MKIVAIGKDDVQVIWPVVAPMLAPAVRLSRGRITTKSVLEWLVDGRYLLWIAHLDDRTPVAAFVTREARYPGKSMLTIDLCGGNNLEGWLDEADRVFRAHSRQSGLSGVELYGRPGWARALRRLGWQQSAVLVETD